MIITNPADQGAAFGKRVQYYFDGDIVQFELVHQTKVETKTFQTTTYYEYDPSASKYQAKGTAEQNSIVVNGQKVAPTTLSYSLRRETDLVTGQATYQIVNNQTNQPVTVDQAGNFTLPGISTLPSLSGYTANTADVVTVRAAQQYNLNTLFTANPDVAALTATQVVHYLPDQQTLTYTMYNETQNKWITTNPIAFLDGKTDEAATGSGAALTQKVHDFLIPKAYDLDQIYYYNSTTGQFETINYTTDFDVDHDGLVAPGVFSGTPEQNKVILYVKDPVSYTQKMKAVSRIIYYHDADQANETLNHLLLNPLSKADYPDMIVQSVDFRRFEVVDNITSAILGYYRPSQMELVNGTWQPKVGAAYLPFVANDPDTGFEIDTTNGNSATLAAVTNYDLTKLGYTGPVDDNGNAFVKIAAVTPNVASKSTVVNVYYHHQLVAVAPDKLPTAGTKVDPTDANSPVYPKNAYDPAAATTTVQRIIHHVYAAGTQINGVDVSGQAVAGLSDTRQEVTFYQDARLDLVTGAITNTGQFRAVKSATTQAGITTSVPNSDQFTAVTSPAIANYVPVDAIVAAAPATVGAAPQTVNVAYVPDNTDVVITYVDADNGGSTITTATLQGPHGSAIDYSTAATLRGLAAKGYTLVTDGYTDDHSGNKYFDNSKVQTWTVVMSHQKLVLDYQHAHASGEEIAAPGYQGKYPQGVTAADLWHRVSRSISFQYANGTTWDGQNLSGQPMRDDKGKELQPLKQTVSYQRQATIDLVKLADPKQAVSAVTYGVWQVTPDSNATFAAVDVLPVAGYEADQTTIKAVAPIIDPTAEPQDATPIVVHYAPLSQEVLVSFVDSEGNVIEPQYKLPGKTGQTVPVADSITPPTGWRLVDPQTGIPSTVTFGREPLPEIKIAIEHATVHLKHDEYHPANTGTLPDNIIRPYPAGVDQADLNRTVTRTIQVHLPDGTIKRTAQVLHFTRGATIDEINGHVTYDSWVAKDGTTMRAVQATDVVATPAGYSPVLSAVELTGVGPDDPDSIVDITYAPNDQHASLIIVDDDAQVNGQPKQLFTTQATGKFGTAIVFNDLKAECDQLTQANYQVDETGLPSASKYQATDTNNHFILHVTHKTAPATGSREVREKISYLFVDKRGVEYSIAPDYMTPADARVVFIEHGTLDLVTGIYTWQHDWSAALKQFNAVQSPEVTGYVVKAQLATVPAQTVALDEATERPVMVNDAWHGSLSQTNADQQVQAWTVSYKVYYDAALQATTVVYQAEDGTPVHTTTVSGMTDGTVQVPDETPAGWRVIAGKVPSEITFGPAGAPQTIVTIAHSHVTVTPDAPKTTDDQLPDNPAKTYPSGVGETDLNKTITRTIVVTMPNGKPTTVNQEAKLTRTADVDEVTGAVKYSDWTMGEWVNYAVPSVPGYTASQPNVAPQTVTSTTETQTVNITYTANPQTTHVNYVDDQGKLIHTTTVNGQTDQTVEVPSEVPDGWKLVDGQTVPNTITFGPDGRADTPVKIEHQHVTVTPDKPQADGTRLPDNPAKTFSGVEAGNLNKLITRTITVMMPAGKVTTVKQAAKLTRMADVDEVTGEVTYSKWTTGAWDAYAVPSVAGYTPSQTAVDQTIVTNTTADTTVVVTYTPNQHQISVTYVDDDDYGKIVQTDRITGKTDQTITITPTAPQGYDLVSAGNQTYTVTGDDGQTVQIHVKHHRVTTSESKPVTRTINVHTPHDGVKTIKQTAELTRAVTTDQVTGEKAYGDWTTGQWAAYTPEVVAGYMPSTNEVPNVNVDGSSSDQLVDVTYIADTQKVEIIYLDDTKGGSVVKTDQVTGKTDEMVKVTPDVPAGYELVGKVPGDYTMTADGHQTITVHLIHQTKTASESKTITRTINVHTPHDGTKVVKQTATLTRAVTTDQVTGEKTYGDWSTAEWDRYAVPTIAGYVPSIEQVAQQVVNGTTTDQTIDVTYSSGEHTTHVNYVDGDGNTVHTTTITGQTDGTVQVPNETPAGWTVVGEPVPNELTFGPDGHADVTVTVDHQHVTVTPDQPKTPTDKLPDNPTKPYPHGVDHDNLNKIITRTIKITTPDGQTKTVEQTVHLTRTADVDEVTGEITYGKWTTGEWSNYDVPTVPGYTPSQSEVPTTKVTDDTKDQTVTVTYTAVDHTTTISYVDQNGKVIHTTVVTGQTDQMVKVPNEVPTGWTVTGQPAPDTVTFGPDGHNNVTVTIDHQHVTVTPDKPQADGTKLPDNPNQTFRGVAETDLNKIVTRTIEVTTPAGKINTIKQTAKLTRTADVDEVTGEVTYGKWTTGTWSSYTAPNVAGYTPSQAVVAEVTVDADTTNQTVKITYTADSHTTHINYVAKDGKVVHTTTVTGAMDQTVKVPNETPAGWTITGDKVPSELTFNADGHVDVTITVDHQHVTVTPDQPKAPTDKLPDNPAKTYPNGVGYDDLNKTVTRTIKVTTPDGQTKTVGQTAKLTRTADVDEVTGAVTYSAWSTGEWPSYVVPSVPGYTPSRAAVASAMVDAATLDQTVMITYAREQAAKGNQLAQPPVIKAPPASGKPQEAVGLNSAENRPAAQPARLPQTGDQTNPAGVLGWSLLGLLTLLGLKRKRRDEGEGG